MGNHSFVVSFMYSIGRHTLCADKEEIERLHHCEAEEMCSLLDEVPIKR